MACLTIDYRALTDKSHFIYLGLLGLLVYVLLFGTVAGGARRWITLRLFNLQPSEFAKIGVALVLAKFFGENRRGAPTTGDLIIGGVLAADSSVLIAREPDLGTAVTIVPIFLGIGMSPGCGMRILGVLALAAIVTAPDRLERSRSRTIRRAGSKRFSIPRRIPEAPGISRFRRRSPWVPAGCGVRDSPRARRDSSGSFRSPTTTSSFPCLRRNRALPECWWCSACICS